MKQMKHLYNFLLAFVVCTAAFGASPIYAAEISAGFTYALTFVPASLALFTGFITNGSEFYGKEMEDIIIRPIFSGTTPKEMGIKVMLSVKSSIKLTFFGPVSKILKAYADGFQGGSASTKTQKKLSLAEFKAENSYSKQDYKNTILENITDVGGLTQNEVAALVLNAEIGLFMNGVKEDVRRIFWLGDTSKKTIVAGYVSATADTDYNVINGIWTALMADAATSPSANQIKRIAISNGTVAQVATHTLTGTSGTANIPINGVNYLATFNTTLTQSATDFYTTWAAALALRGITVTHSGATVILTAAVAGTPFTTTLGINVSGDMAGTVVQTTANTAAQDLATDEAVSTMKLMYNGSSKILKSMLKTGNVSNARFYLTDTMIENYMATLEVLQGGIPQTYFNLVDGISRLTYRGIPIIPMDIDQHIAADFVSPYPHRAILTLPENLVLVLNGASDIAETKFWFNPDLNVNRQRTQFEFGADYILPELITVAY